MTNIVTIMIRLSFYFLIWLGASCSRPDDEGTSPIKLPANPPKVDITRKLGVLPEFHLMDQGAQAFDHTTFQGKVWVANFIFTRCGSTCPMQTKALVDIQANLRSSATLAEVRLVSFTVDPEYDTPPVLAEYGKSFGADPARWKFVTGTREALWTLSKASNSMLERMPRLLPCRSITVLAWCWWMAMAKFVATSMDWMSRVCRICRLP